MVALKRSLILVFVMVSMVITAQDSFVTENFTDEKIEGRFDQFIGREDGFIFMTAHTKDSWVVHKVDEATLQSVKVWEADVFDYDGLKTELMAVTLSRMGFHHVFMAYNRSKKEVSFIETLIKRNGEVVAPREIGLVENVGPRDDIEVQFSKDRSQVCIGSLLDDEKGIKLFVFDASGHRILEKEMKNPFSEKYTLMDMKVSNAGAVWLAGFRQAEPISYAGLKASEGYVVMKIDDGAGIEMFDLKQTGKRMIGVSVALDQKKDTVFVHGFYSDDSDGYFNGVYQAQIGERELMKYSDSYAEVDRSFLAQLDESWKETRPTEIGLVREAKLKPFLGLASFKVKNCYLFDDGNMGLVGERSYYHVTTQYATTFKDDLLVMKLSSIEGVVWKKQVPKKGYVGTVSEVMIYEGNDNVNLVFAGSIKNKETMLNGGVTKHEAGINKNGVVYIAKVPSNGEVKIGSVSNWAKQRGWYMFEVSELQPVDDKSFVLYLRYGERETFKLSRLSL